MLILGVNCYSHDASATLIKDGQIVASIEEERLNRIKHSTVFPVLAIRECLRIGGRSFSDIDRVAYYFRPGLELYGNLWHMVKHFPDSLNLLRQNAVGDELATGTRLKLQFGLGRTLRREFGGARPPKVDYVEHHLAHAASAFYGSPFEKAAILTWDGRGERATTLLAVGDGARIAKIGELTIPNSLGHLYTALTDHLGFRAFLDEWKVMGMSAYGTPALVDAFSELIRLKPNGAFELNLKYFSFHTHGRTRWLSPDFISRFGPARSYTDPLLQSHYDLAFALQRTVERAGMHVVNDLHRRTGLSALCMTGGVALNVLLNQKIVAEGPFEKVFIQPIASDAGTSLGAALYSHHQLQGHTKRTPFSSAYLGPEFTDGDIESALKAHGVSYLRMADIAAETAKHVHAGKIVGWFQGRMEAGPRALGNRSIVVNPTDPGMKDVLNRRVKKREHFRPFAPSVLEERADRYFEMPKNATSPYMILSGKVRAGMDKVIPAVTHFDGTARVHTVNREANPRYWALIREFEKLSGVAVVLNTSFNENEPIVCTPEDAVKCFLRTEFDVLAIGDYLVVK